MDPLYARWLFPTVKNESLGNMLVVNKSLYHHKPVSHYTWLRRMVPKKSNFIIKHQNFPRSRTRDILSPTHLVQLLDFWTTWPKLEIIFFLDYFIHVFAFKIRSYVIWNLKTPEHKLISNIPSLNPLLSLLIIKRHLVTQQSHRVAPI